MTKAINLITCGTCLGIGTIHVVDVPYNSSKEVKCPECKGNGSIEFEDIKKALDYLDNRRKPNAKHY